MIDLATASMLNQAAPASGMQFMKNAYFNVYSFSNLTAGGAANASITFQVASPGFSIPAGQIFILKNLLVDCILTTNASALITSLPFYGFVYDSPNTSAVITTNQIIYPSTSFIPSGGVAPQTGAFQPIMPNSSGFAFTNKTLAMCPVLNIQFSNAITTTFTVYNLPVSNIGDTVTIWTAGMVEIWGRKL